MKINPLTIPIAIVAFVSGAHVARTFAERQPDETVLRIGKNDTYPWTMDTDAKHGRPIVIVGRDGKTVVMFPGQKWRNAPGQVPSEKPFVISNSDGCKPTDYNDGICDRPKCDVAPDGLCI